MIAVYHGTNKGGYSADQMVRKHLKSMTQVLFNNGPIVEARFYVGRRRQASRVYCTLEVITDRSGLRRAVGWAGGSGHHKQSAALQAAITNAGYTLHGDVYALRDSELTPLEREEALEKKAFVDGVGDGAIRLALLAIAHDAHPHAEADEFNLVTS